MISNNVKAITIPEGNVTKITANGTVLWKKPASYINLAEPNDTNTTEWGLWMNNARLGSDGTYRSHTTSMLTNFIQFEGGDTIYFGGMEIPENGFAASQVGSGYQVGFYQTDAYNIWIGDKSFAAFKSAYSTYLNYTVDSDGYVTSMSTGSVWDTSAGEFDSTYFLRIALPNTIDKSKIIITKNQPIM